MSSGFPRVAVVGGSIGGLTAALALRRLGCEVDVYERSAAALRDRGAGIGLHPMITRYFDDTAALEEDKVAVEVPWLRFLDPDGSIRYRERMNYRFSSWSTVYRALLAGLPGERYHLGRDMIGFDQDDAGVSLRFAAGETVRADLLVCAEGVASRSRAALQPGARPVYAGYVAWRALVPEAALPRAAFEALRDGLTYGLLPAGHVLVYPIPGPDGGLAPGERFANLVWYHNYAEGAAFDEVMTDRDGTRRELSLPPGAVREDQIAWCRRFAARHMAPAIAEVVAGAERPFLQAIVDIEVERMAFGRVCLIGDGAFAVRPHAAAGTAKACADGWALADALASAAGDVRRALRLWEPAQLALGRALLRRTREMGDRSQFRHDWVPGDPDLRFGLRGPGR